MNDRTDEIKMYYEDICAGKEVRRNLISLRDAIKDEAGKRTLAYLFNGDFSSFCALLDAEDPKIRKNAALVLGAMESEDLLPVLFDAYSREETLFVRTDYLKAISKMDYRPIADQLEQRYEQLCSVKEWPPEEWKHISEEIRVLQSMVLHCRGIRQHRFSGSKERETVILMTNRRHREATAEQITKGKITMLAGGLRVEGASLKEILQIRTYSELLFPLDAGSVQPGTKENSASGADSVLDLPAKEPEQCGAVLAKPVLMLADRIYRGAGAFLFRVDLRCGAGNVPFSAEDKGSYIRKISNAMERASGGRLFNSVSEYEIEIRLVLRKNGSYVAMLKPSPVFDSRFSYRRETVAASVAPVNAALTVWLSHSWMKEGAQVLDPFCGVGTMLVERDRAVKAGPMYGIDLFGEAIEKARRNTQRAGCRVNYINRDFFTFRHDYPFDEVITDMPTTAGEGTKRELRQLYHRFFEKIQDLLKKEAVLILYTSSPNYVVESVQGSGQEAPPAQAASSEGTVQYHDDGAGKRVNCFHIEKSFLLNEKNGTTVFVISYKRTGR